ncbi:MAG: outer membrane beta-barrel protein [Sulfurimonas sp.]|jgi:opacity protein-like surface antigen
MKKVLSLVAAVAVLGSSALFADSHKDVHVGASVINVQDTTGQAVNIGYGGNTVWSNNFMMGLSMDFQGGKIDVPKNSTAESSLFGLSADVQIGYVPLKDVTAYGIGTALGQSVGNVEGAGFGYGAGIDYAVTKYFTVSAEYKTYAMKNEAGNYDYATSGINLRYTWR